MGLSKNILYSSHTAVNKASIERHESTLFFEAQASIKILCFGAISGSAKIMDNWNKNYSKDIF